MKESIKIVIADDHRMIREGLKQLLELEGDITIVGEAGDGLSCLQVIEDKKPDVVLLDINMPQMNGLQVLEKLKERKCRSKILILTIHNEIEYLVKAVDIGVDGYVLKDSESELLRKAIFSVYSGENYIQAELVPILKEKLENQEKDILTEDSILTKRELEVLRLLTEGLFNKEIAYNLSISEKTVKNHVSNIFKKICVSDRTQAAVYAIKNNIVELY
ncbi:DNA-binding response regulator [Anaerocolumna cellulosilytica]|uniref:Stage 0 sporulation protein A homolog n=1 Tax=Anaerocolumna cellulosilytica TaxID=433286 RepID=A0A6S6R6G4_9FIRM|nr:response regulator transcription factor [Anaerocolumna cellulosilytica]MBB5195938.1 DNA-binding NarL/FixJ family response regulator [Anaerocolumna cellulosilytica]BCJ96949.1 DNA-binding response regulator [Anaerocolumna cellulosilytica]